MLDFAAEIVSSLGLEDIVVVLGLDAHELDVGMSSTRLPSLRKDATHVSILGLRDGNPRVGILGVPDDVVALGGQAEGVRRSKGRRNADGRKEGDQLHVVV